jgi:hypothetical protein
VGNRPDGRVSGYDLTVHNSTPVLGLGGWQPRGPLVVSVVPFSLFLFPERCLEIRRQVRKGPALS